MKMAVDAEWLKKHADLEGDLEISAGRRTKTIDLTPEEVAELEELAVTALPEWAQKEIKAYRALIAAPASDAELPSWEDRDFYHEVRLLASKLWREDQPGTGCTSENRDYYMIRAVLRLTIDT